MATVLDYGDDYRYGAPCSEPNTFMMRSYIYAYTHYATTKEELGNTTFLLAKGNMVRNRIRLQQRQENMQEECFTTVAVPGRGTGCCTWFDTSIHTVCIDAGCKAWQRLTPTRAGCGFELA